MLTLDHCPFLLDLSTAFNAVDHAILLRTLAWPRWDCSELGFIHLIQEYSGWVWTTVLPQLLWCHVGSHRGSVFGPILFSLYSSPLGNVIHNFTSVSYHWPRSTLGTFQNPENHNGLDFALLPCCHQGLDVLQLPTAEHRQDWSIGPNHFCNSVSPHCGPLTTNTKQSARNLAKTST